MMNFDTVNTQFRINSKLCGFLENEITGALWVQSDKERNYYIDQAIAQIYDQLFSVMQIDYNYYLKSVIDLPNLGTITIGETLGDSNNYGDFIQLFRTIAIELYIEMKSLGLLSNDHFFQYLGHDRYHVVVKVHLHDQP